MAYRSFLGIKSLFPSVPPGSPPPDGRLLPEAADTGARLMALLKHQTSSPGTSDIEPSMPSAPPKPRSDDSVGSVRKAGIGRDLVGSHIVYDCDIRVSEESQPQLEVTPITKYVSEALLSPGRQIAVNQIYICYALRQGQIRILNMKSAVRALLKGHTQRVTDMAFFSDDVHLLASASVDGVVMVRRLAEMEIDGKLVIHQQLLAYLQLSGPWGEAPLCPVVCWQFASQESVAVACGSTLFLLSLPQIASTNNWETPLPCSEEAPPPGLQILSPHAAPIVCLASGPSLAVGCEDGQVVLWSGGGQSVVLPHQQHAVHSVLWAGVGEPSLLLTGGPTNNELKLWAGGPEGWHCIQTLELRASLATAAAPAFYNHVCVLPAAGLILLANACRPAIYAVQLREGRMGYLAEFAVTMPILSFTARCEADDQVQLFCVQTEAIQMHTMKLEDCRPSHPPPQEKEEQQPQAEPQLEPQPEPQPEPKPQPESQPPLLDPAPAALPPPSPPPPALLLAPATHNPPDLAVLPPSLPPLPPQPPAAPASLEESAKGPAPGTRVNRKAKPKHISLPSYPLPLPLPAPSPSTPPLPLDSALQAAMEQVVAGQQELGGRLAALISAPIAKEGKRVEAAVGLRVERALKAREEDATAKGEEEAAWRESLRVSLVGELEAVVTEQVRLGLERLGREVEAVVRSSLQEAMRASFAGVLVPAVERGCGAMVQQVQAVLGELRQDAQDKAALPLQVVEEALDPTRHLTRLLAEHKYQEAFSAVLNNSDVPIAWVCTQLDPATVLPSLDSRTQLVLAVQLGWDLKEEEETKVKWLLQLVPLLNPSDPEMASHMRGMLTQLYNKLHTQLPTVSPHQAPSLRLVVHVVNSLLTACK